MAWQGVAHVAIAVEVAHAEAVEGIEADDVGIDLGDDVAEAGADAGLVELHEAIVRMFHGVDVEAGGDARPIVSEPGAQALQVGLKPPLGILGLKDEPFQVGHVHAQAEEGPAGDGARGELQEQAGFADAARAEEREALAAREQPVAEQVVIIHEAFFEEFGRGADGEGFGRGDFAHLGEGGLGVFQELPGGRAFVPGGLEEPPRDVEGEPPLLHFLEFLDEEGQGPDAGDGIGQGGDVDAIGGRIGAVLPGGKAVHDGEHVDALMRFEELFHEAEEFLVPEVVEVTTGDACSFQKVECHLLIE